MQIEDALSTIAAARLARDQVELDNQAFIFQQQKFPRKMKYKRRFLLGKIER